MSIPSIEILRTIWSHSRGDWAFLSTMERKKSWHRGTWKDYPIQYLAALPLDHQPHRHDLFFSPLRFNTNQRSNETVGSPGVLFADLDDAPTVYGNLPPSILWETSPGNRQGVWLLSGYNHDYTYWSNVNKRLTRHMKADPGGWMGSKVLRVPESVNWKREAFGQVIWFNPDRVYALADVNSELPLDDPVTQPTLTGDYPKLPRSKESTAIIVSRWDSLSLRGRNMLMQEKVKDRSLHIVKTIHELSGGGLSPEDIFVMIWNRPWNKWRFRNRPDTLWSEILNCME